MAKLEIPVRVYMEEFEEIINELKHLQTYKLFEGDDKVLINCDDVVEIFADHLRAEILSGSTIEQERKKEKWIPCSESLPEEGKQVLACDAYGFIYTAECEVISDDERLDWRWYPIDDVVAWMPLPKPWEGEEDGELA